jgi:hypothetical protein
VRLRCDRRRCSRRRGTASTGCGGRLCTTTKTHRACSVVTARACIARQPIVANELLGAAHRSQRRLCRQSSFAAHVFTSLAADTYMQTNNVAYGQRQIEQRFSLTFVDKHKNLEFGSVQNRKIGAYSIARRVAGATGECRRRDASVQRRHRAYESDIIYIQHTLSGRRSRVMPSPAPGVRFNARCTQSRRSVASHTRLENETTILFDLDNVEQHAIQFVNVVLLSRLTCQPAKRIGQRSRRNRLVDRQLQIRKQFL